MPRFDEMPEFIAQLPRTPHDLSHKLGFTATVAHLLPVYHDFLNPGETVELGFDFNLRTQPLQSAAMVELTCHTEYFFVPMQLLYEPFGSMYYDIVDNYSSNYPANGSDVQPVLDSFPVLDFAEASYAANNNAEELDEFENFGCSCTRLLDMLGYNPFILGTAEQAWNPNTFPYPLLAYQCIFQYYYRLDTRQRFNQHRFNWDRFYNTSVVSPSVLGSDDAWNEFVMGLFKLHYRPLSDDYFTNVKVSPIVDVLNLNVKNSLQVANQWLTRGSLTSAQGSNSVLSSGSVGNNSGNASGFVPPFYQENPASSVQTQFGFNVLTREQTPIINGLDIGTANIRAMFATEKLWSITGRARKHYDDQTLAHFGFKVPHDVKHEITCFGHDQSKIHIGEVISTSATEGAPLGEIAGKGYGEQHNQRHTFKAPCHGVVMIIQSFVPDLNYSNTYLKANAVASKNDLYQPEYDHLGMQPLFGYECKPYVAASRNYIVGWQYRYEQWKRRYNRTTLAFNSATGIGDGSLDSWMLDFAPYYGSINANMPNYGNVTHFLYRPDMLNQIMMVNYVTSVPSYSNLATIYDGDPFVVDSFVYSKKVSTMSDYSLPRLDA